MEYLSFEPPLRRTNRGEIVRTDLASPPRATSLPLSPIIAHFSLSLSLMRWRKHKGHRVLAAVANDEALRSLLTGRLETIISREKRAATFRGGHYPRRNCARRRTSSLSSFLQIQDLLLRESGGSIVVFRIKI